MADDNKIIELLIKQDESAVDELVKKYGTRLLRSAYLLCGNHADSEEIVQDTFITAINIIKKFRGKSAFYTWLHGILINKTRHLLRKRKIFIPMEEIPEPVCSSDHINSLDLKLVRENLLKTINNLSFCYRVVVILRYFEEFKISEIAQTLQISKGTVKSRLHYALKLLRKTVSNELRTL